MQIIRKKLSFAKGQQTAEVLYGACWHIGNPCSSEGAIEKFIERAVKQSWWHAGDLVEGITPSDKRSQASEHSDTLLSTMSVASGHLASASKTCWGLICGNHEYGGSGDIGSVAEKIAVDAKVPYLGMVVYFSVQCPKGDSLIFAAHGAGSMGFNSGLPERDQINRELKLRRILKPFQADVKCVAHYHRTIISPRVTHYKGTVQQGQFKRRACVENNEWCMACPSLFGNYGAESMGSYAEMKLYPPTDIGWLGIVFNRDGSVACIREYSSDGVIAQEVEERLVR